MIHFIKKIAPISLALLVLLSTFSFTVESHYCGSFLMAMSITGTTNECAADSSNANSIKIKDCCFNEVQEIVGQKELQQEKILQLEASQHFAITSSNCYFLNSNVFKVVENKWLKKSLIANATFNYQIAHQTFII